MIGKTRRVTNDNARENYNQPTTIEEKYMDEEAGIEPLYDKLNYFGFMPTATLTWREKKQNY